MRYANVFARPEAEAISDEIASSRPRSGLAKTHGMTRYSIHKISATEILDSRGSPTVEVTVSLRGGATGTASVPSGKSTGIHEAHELRDGDKKRYGGRGVLRAVRNVQGPLAKKIKGMDVRNLEAIDTAMIALDDTENKSRLGANAILGVSLACARAGALATGRPLYQYLRDLSGLRVKGWRMPRLLINVINGGAHAGWNLDIQEFHIIPHARTVRESMRMAEEIVSSLGLIVHTMGLSTTSGDEGGFAPEFPKNEDALRIISRAIRSAKFTLGRAVGMGMDVAASEFYDQRSGVRGQKSVYIWKHPKKKLTATSLVSLLKSWTRRYPLEYIEDPVAEDDYEGWRIATKSLSLRVPTEVGTKSPYGRSPAGGQSQRFIVGDDFFVTNEKRLATGIAAGLANAVLIKPNQAGTLTETLATIRKARKYGYGVVVSHRSGETADTFIADLAVAVGADLLKSGGLLHGERVVKYLRLMQIERETRNIK